MEQPSEIHTPALTNAVHEGREVFLTSDLVVRHPTVENAYKIHGRADDQIITECGGRINPGPLGVFDRVGQSAFQLTSSSLEHIICRNPQVRSALMFGRSRPKTGVLIEPAVPVGTWDEEKLETFKRVIWCVDELLVSFMAEYFYSSRPHVDEANQTVLPFACIAIEVRLSVKGTKTSFLWNLLNTHR